MALDKNNGSKAVAVNRKAEIVKASSRMKEVTRELNSLRPSPKEWMETINFLYHGEKPEILP